MLARALLDRGARPDVPRLLTVQGLALEHVHDMLAGQLVNEVQGHAFVISTDFFGRCVQPPNAQFFRHFKKMQFAQVDLSAVGFSALQTNKGVKTANATLRGGGAT